MNTFAFGLNWNRFIREVDESALDSAIRSMKSMLRDEDIAGKTFLDVGSGSGLMSAAARRLGAKVRSFDYDRLCAECTCGVKGRFAPFDRDWTIDIGSKSILDDDFVSTLGKYDIVYSWGVLHHTGNMRKAFENVAKLVRPGGLLFISIYNDQGALSRYWKAEKWLFNHGFKWPLIAFHLPLLVGRILVRKIRHRPLERGMSYWHDYVDWLGGYPFEVATAGDVIKTFLDFGFAIERTKRVGRKSGCNEFVFRHHVNTSDT